jgi:hypothetical protein
MASLQAQFQMFVAQNTSGYDPTFKFQQQQLWTENSRAVFSSQQSSGRRVLFCRQLRVAWHQNSEYYYASNSSLLA